MPLINYAKLKYTKANKPANTEMIIRNVKVRINFNI